MRRAAVQWVGEEHLTEFRGDVEELLGSEPMTADLFAACLATLSLLDGQSPAEFEKAPPVSHILPLVLDSKRPASTRAIALRMLPAGLPELNANVTRELLAARDPSLQIEAVRSLQQSTIAERETLLLSVVTDEKTSPELKLEAIAALPSSGQARPMSDEAKLGLLQLTGSDDPAVVLEAMRSLRSESSTEGLPAEIGQGLRERIVQLNGKRPDLEKQLQESLSFLEGRKPAPNDLLIY